MKNYPLRVLLWETTLNCNAHCEFCGSRCGASQADNELTTQEICRAFDQIAERYDATKIMINVTGGEPLVRPDVFDVMKYAADLGFPWGLVSNGMLITEKTVEKMKDSQMKTISISIDGLPDTHDRIRGVKNGFQKIENAIYLLKEASFVETVMITTVASKNNIHELAALKEYLRALPIDVWRICPVDPIGRAEDDSSFLLSSEEMNEVFQFIHHCRNEQLPFSVTTSCSHYLGNYELSVRDFPFQCNAGRTVASILSNGDIFVCPNVPRRSELIQGNVRTENFVDVWENRFHFFRNPFRCFKGDCEKCGLFAKCGGDSLHTWDFERNQPKVCIKTFQKDFNLVKVFDLPSISLRELFHKYKGEEKLYDSFVHKQSLSEDIVVLSPAVTEKLLQEFKWGNKERSKEQICGLYGEIYNDSERKKESDAVIVEITDFIPMEIQNATETQLLLTDSIIENAKRIVDDSKQFLGFAHTHPNELTIAMSIGDYEFHKKLFHQDWKQALTLIVNPQKKHIAAYAGPAANHVDLHILTLSTPI